MGIASEVRFRLKDEDIVARVSDSVPVSDRRLSRSARALMEAVSPCEASSWLIGSKQREFGA